MSQLLDLTEEQIAALEARTEGWIAGLQLAALALQALSGQATVMPGLGQQDQIAGFVRSFGGSHRYVMDYLMDEVLAAIFNWIEADAPIPNPMAHG